MLKIRKKWLVFLALLAVAAGFRIAVAHWLPNDAPDDGRVYAQIARDVLEQHVYSQASEPPYDPTFIRLPGYPLFLAGIYAIFGHGNNGAVRIVQALIDTGTCALVALLAFYWQPDEKRKRATAMAALALAAVCPFTTIYAATILTEVPAMFLAVAACVVTTIAFRTSGIKRSLRWWCFAGILAGLGVLFRPDSGLFAICICLTVAVMAAIRFKERGLSALVGTATFSVALLLVLVPWTARNWRVFHRFQPLAPMHAEMPDEFFPHGYVRWLKTWLDDTRYVDEFWWQLDSQPIAIDDVPSNAFDSADERNRVATLLDRYNHPDSENSSAKQPPPGAAATPESSPQAAADTRTQKTTNTNQKMQPSPKSNANTNSNSPASGDESDQNDNSSDQADESDNDQADEADESKPEEQGPVQMTPELDSAFGQIAAERIARHPLRYYLWTPAKRAKALWFNNHSDYYPFEGALFPLDDLDYETHQQIWLPLFAVLVGLYSIAGVGGAVVLWKTGDFQAKAWVLLAALIIFGRLAFFSSNESPEPRYVVELFPFLTTLGALAVARITRRAA